MYFEQNLNFLENVAVSKMVMNWSQTQLSENIYILHVLTFY